VVAIIVPDKDQLVKWATENGVANDNYTELLKNEKVTKLYQEEVKAKCKEAGVSTSIKYNKFIVLWLRDSPASPPDLDCIHS
jgi:long-subunit acyl-CoA synthetase (AMP-forming)